MFAKMLSFVKFTGKRRAKKPLMLHNVESQRSCPRVNKYNKLVRYQQSQNFYHSPGFRPQTCTRLLPFSGMCGHVWLLLLFIIIAMQ